MTTERQARTCEQGLVRNGTVLPTMTRGALALARAPKRGRAARMSQGPACPAEEGNGAAGCWWRMPADHLAQDRLLRVEQQRPGHLLTNLVQPPLRHARVRAEARPLSAAMRRVALLQMADRLGV